MNYNIIQKVCKTGAKVTASIATIGGVYGVINEVIHSTRTFIDVIISTEAIVIYILILITIIFLLLNDKYKGLTKKIDELNVALNQKSALLDSALRNGKIAKFKNRFFLSTEKLYLDLAEKIQNDITISYMAVHNTIETTGIGNKRDSKVTLYIQGVAIKRTSQIQILVAGDTIVNWEDIKFDAFEIKNDKKIKLKARLADNGIDSSLKQVVISCSDKQEGDIVNLVISWKWPNMLSIDSEDYTTLPIVLAPQTQKIEMSITPAFPIDFCEAGIYLYKVGMEDAKLIKDLSIGPNCQLYYSDDEPSYKSCYILYYKINSTNKS